MVGIGECIGRLAHARVIVEKEMPGKEDYGNVCVCVFGATRNNCVDILIHQLERRRWLRVVLEEERGTQRRPSCIMQMSDEADEIWVID